MSDGEWQDAGQVIRAGLPRLPALASQWKGRGGIYRLALDRPVGRVVGENSILYIGGADDFWTRLNTKHHVLPRLAEVLDHENFKSAAVSLHLRTADDPWYAEACELDAYRQRHCELPPLNFRPEGYVVGQAMKRLATTLKKMGLIQGFFAPRDLKKESVTVCKLRRRGTTQENPELLWSWPEIWLEMDRPAWWNVQEGLLPDALYLSISGVKAWPHAKAGPWQRSSRRKGWLFQPLTTSGWRERLLLDPEGAAREPLTVLQQSRR